MIVSIVSSIVSSIGRVVTGLVAMVAIVNIAGVGVACSQQRVSIVTKAKVLGLQKTTLVMMVL